MKQFFEWIGSLNEPRDVTNGIPTCPYARRAVEDGKVAIIFKTRFGGLFDLNEIVSEWSGQFEVILLVVPRTQVDADAAQAVVKRANGLAAIIDLVVMVDHPDRPFIVAGQNNSNGEFVIFFVQQKSKLEAASAALKARGYYRNWET